MIIAETKKNAGQSPRRRIGISRFEKRTDVLVNVWGDHNLCVLLTRAQARRLGTFLLKGK